LNARDAKAVRKTVAGFVKLLHPDRQVTTDELREYVEIAMEGRRRVKEQLKKMGAFEYSQTSFSFIDVETRQEQFVGVPEEGGHALIAADPLPVGATYGASITPDDKVAIFRVEVTGLPGSGRLRLAGTPSRSLRDSIQTAFDYVRARQRELGVEAILEKQDYHVQVIDLVASREDAEAGMPFFVALASLLRGAAVLPSLVVIGQVSIQGHVSSVHSLAELLQSIMDNGARRALIPMESRRQYLDAPMDVAERVDPIFYADTMTAAVKALGLN
jgi:ATP-dependent Lon protease